MTAETTVARTIALCDELGRLPIVPAQKAGLRRISFLLGRLGNPHLDFHSVHIAGSTGKGSTTTMIGSILQAAGFRTGYFRSPHLVSYTERIAINGVDIATDDWVRYFERVWPVCEEMTSGRSTDYTYGRPSLSEIWFAMAASYFRDQGIEWAAVETGLGGRLDSTNVLQSDAAVITNISLEHTQILGKTIDAIAAEKAAIIKQGTVAITSATPNNGLEVIERRASDMNASLLRVPTDVRVEACTDPPITNDLCIHLPDDTLHVRLALAGSFQAINAGTAAACALALMERGVRITKEDVVHGLEAAMLPGRFEKVSSRPTVILDGAHSPAAAIELGRSLDALLHDGRIYLLFAAMNDKDVEAMAEALGPRAQTVVLTTVPDTDRSSELPRLLDAFSRHTDDVRAIEEPFGALQSAYAQMDDTDVLVVCGSLYLVGWARNCILHMSEKV